MVFLADVTTPWGVWASLPNSFQQVCLLVAIGMLIWDTVEVGRNDAANLVNAVFGSRVMSRRAAVLLAGVAVVAGATLSSEVINTARKGIFDPLGLPGLEHALAIYISVYIVDTVLLYSYSAFGMPVSTTACLVFELMGAAAAIQIQTVKWGKAGIVVSGIVCSIVLTGFAAFLLQRAARGAIGDGTKNLKTLLLHGGWVGGGISAGLCYFLMLKGMKSVSVVADLNTWIKDENISAAIIVLVLWGGFAILIHVTLLLFRDRAARRLFPFLAVAGMLAMAFAFGQNDLANCASPGLSSYTLLREGGLEGGTTVPIDRNLLFICGLLLVVGMSTKNADRVTRAEVNTGSMGHHVALYAPNWCIRLARWFLSFKREGPSLAPTQKLADPEETQHYDTLRASVITSVAASIIATASSLGLPVSTTYVAFSAVVATGMADRIFQRGDASLKLGRSIWVVSSWFISAMIAAVAAGIVATVIFHTGVAGIVVCISANLFVRWLAAHRANLQEKRVQEATLERTRPEVFALEDETV